MKTLEEIKNEVAKEIGYENYNEYIKELYKNSDFYFVERINKLNNEIAERYAKEVAIASLEKASENVSFETKEHKGRNFMIINKYSITNEENIVL